MDVDEEAYHNLDLAQLGMPAWVLRMLGFAKMPLVPKSHVLVQNGPRHEKTCLWWFANNKVTDQPVLPLSLMRVLVIRLFESIISRLAMSDISNF